MNRSISIIFLLVGTIHLMPVVGIFGLDKLNALYAIQIDPAQTDLALLMRHRAILLGIVGLLLFYAAFHSAVQTLGIYLAGVSVGSFIVLSWLVGEINTAVQRVIAIDWFALGLLIVALICILYRDQERRKAKSPSMKGF